MRRILAISPHLDDAVFSAGGTLSAHARQGDQVTVLTCFTGNVDRPEGFALACQLDKGLPPGIDYMALRRAEDRAACTAIGAAAVHLPFLEAPHRGYPDAAALFAGVRDDDLVGETLARCIADHVDWHQPTLIYGPYGVGRHVDHVIVRDAVQGVAGEVPIDWWEDFPYAMRGDEAPADIERRALDAPCAEAKRQGALAYASQLGFQFGSREQAEAALSDWRVEGFARG